MESLLKNLVWVLSSSDKKDGVEITIHEVMMQWVSLKPTINDWQEAMNAFVKAVLSAPRYVHEFECYGLVRAMLRDLLAKGAQFPVDKMFEFRDGSVEEAVYDFPSRVALMFASNNDLNWSRDVEAVNWEEVMDMCPTKELLTKCLKAHVENYSYMLLW